MEKRIGIYPGTFDPITNGHLDIIQRGLKLFDLLYVVVPNNIQKNTLFTVEERISLLKEVLKDYGVQYEEEALKIIAKLASRINFFTKQNLTKNKI